jgi:hypothetical protein
MYRRLLFKATGRRHGPTTFTPTTGSYPVSQRQLPCTSLRNRYFHATRFNAASNQDYYETLGVARTASEKDIKRAYYQVRLGIYNHINSF